MPGVPFGEIMLKTEIKLGLTFRMDSMVFIASGRGTLANTDEDDGVLCQSCQ